jgi:hypothetical protein
MLTIAEIKIEVDRLAPKISASGYYLPTYGRSEDFARPHIEVDARGYQYVVIERGEELKRITTNDLNELLYQIFEPITSRLACDYELAHRVESQDCRRLNFQHQVDLLLILSKEWSLRKAQQRMQILLEYPFDDFANTRADLSKQVGWKTACEKYPLPVKTAANLK